MVQQVLENSLPFTLIVTRNLLDPINVPELVKFLTALPVLVVNVGVQPLLAPNRLRPLGLLHDWVTGLHRVDFQPLLKSRQW